MIEIQPQDAVAAMLATLEGKIVDITVPYKGALTGVVYHQTCYGLLMPGKHVDEFAEWGAFPVRSEFVLKVLNPSIVTLEQSTNPGALERAALEYLRSGDEQHTVLAEVGFRIAGGRMTPGAR